MKDIEETFERLKANQLLNTSYPLHVEDWQKYRVPGSLSFDGETALAFYIHIPFCKQLCSFCEYCRMPLPAPGLQKKYLQTLQHDIDAFTAQYNKYHLYGFDIGGGTPTSLEVHNFNLLLDIYDNTVAKQDLVTAFEPSIEATFQTLTIDKIRRIVQSGIKRISLGVQTTDTKLLVDNHRRASQTKEMQYWMDVMHECGIEKVNLDLMYGLNGQNKKSIERDLQILQVLHPEQITLYELRTNTITSPQTVTKSQRYSQYQLLWEGIHDMGYIGRFGQNTFSLNDKDFGMSSYLRQRMQDGASYKGFGISAQSMSSHGLAYNKGKLSKDILQYVKADNYAEEYTYKLPMRERLAKFISISAYSGALSLKSLNLITGKDARSHFSRQIEFVLQKGLFTQSGSLLHITKKGFMNYGAAFALFYTYILDEHLQA